MKLLFLYFATWLSCFAAAPEPMGLTLEAPIEKWDEAVPLGNGLLGGLLWGQGHELRLSLDRGDLWDLRQHPIYARPEFNYATVVAHAQAGQTELLNKEFAHPSDYPTTLADLDRLGTSAWNGYSFSWMAALRARVGRGDEALRFLSAYREHTTSRNGFHLNGVITASKISNYRGRAFTLEGNFAAAQAVHEMLLQGAGGRLRVFPALPSTWRDTSFRDLRAEGGFVVSAEQRDGRVRRVAIRATVDQDLRVVDPFSGRAFDHNLPITRAAGEIRCALRAGQTLELSEPAPPAPTAHRSALISHVRRRTGHPCR